MLEFKKYLRVGYYKGYFIALYVMAFVNSAYATEADIGVAPTLLVESSTELISADLSISNLPKTISLGWETEAEILELKRQLIEFNLVSSKTCMSWFYMRIGDRTKLFMLSPFDTGVLRLNNRNFDFRSLGSYLEASPTSANLNEIFRGPQFFYDRSKRVSLFFASIDIKSVVKSSKDTTCTFTKVKCRRYEFSTFPFVFHAPINEVIYTASRSERLAIKSAITKHVSFFAEDMCPHTSNGLMEVRHNHRMGETGDFFNSLTGGIAFNRDIKKALMEDLKK